MTQGVNSGPRPNLSEEEFPDGPLSSVSIRALLGVLEIDYPVLLQRRSGRLGTKEAAVEALHDTYIKLRSGPAIGQIRSPRAYLYRMALNLARNKQRNDARIVLRERRLPGSAGRCPEPGTCRGRCTGNHPGNHCAAFHVD